MKISPSLLDEFRMILREEYDMEPSEEEVEKMAYEILRYYRTLERLSNRYL